MIVARFLVFLGLLAAATPSPAQNLANGESIFMGICRACHGFPPSGGPDRAAGNPGMIQDAINFRVPAMSFLRGVLSSQDINDVAAFLLSLSSPNPPPPPPPAPPTVLPQYDFTDLWWNPQESGWGLNIIQHASHALFGVMYTYDTSRRATWFVMTEGRWTTPLQYTGDVFRATGPHYNQPSFDAGRVGVVKAGTFTLDFSSREAGTFTYVVDGIQVAKPIARQPF